MKIISKNIGKTEKFYWTNFNKIRRFLLNQDESDTNCAVDKHTKISVKISVELYIGRYSKGQILADISAGL